jgi:hypothetical protein
MHAPDGAGWGPTDWLFEEDPLVDPVWDYRKDDRIISAAILAWAGVIILLILLIVLVYFPGGLAYL